MDIAVDLDGVVWDLMEVFLELYSNFPLHLIKSHYIHQYNFI